MTMALIRLRGFGLAALVLISAAPLEAREIEVHGRLIDAAAAEIVLRPAASSAAAGSEDAVARVRSGEDGSFRIAAPGPGMWRLEVEAAGSVPIIADLEPLLARRDLGEISVPKARPQSVRVVDAEGAAVAGLRLAAGGTIATPRGRPGWSLGDRTAVTDDDGRAVFQRAEDEHFFVAAAEGGHYVWAELEPGETKEVEILPRPLEEARVVDADGHPAAGVLGFFQRPHEELGRSGEDGAILLPAAAELAFADADGPLKGELRRTEDGLVVELSRARTVAGRIVDARTGDGLAGALVWTQEAHAETDRQGAFALRLGADGQVHAALSGYMPAAWGGRYPGAVAGPWDPFSGELTIALHPAASLSGTVVDPDGRGLSGATVRADGSGVRQGAPESISFFRRRMMRPPPVEAATDREGRFELEGLSPGSSYRLQARRPGFVPAVVDSATAGLDAELLRIVLEHGLVASATIVDGGRDPIAGAQVTLVAVRPPGLSSQAESDAAGRVVFDDLSPGLHLLRAWAEGFSDAEVPGLEISPDAETELGTIDLGTIVLGPAVTLRGRVTDAEGRPLAGVDVMIHGDFRRGLLERGEAATREDGVFEVGNLSRGERLTLIASREGYQSLHRELASAGDGEPLELVMNRGLVFRVRVVDAEGRPAAGAMVTVERRHGGGSSGRSVTVDGEGRFNFSGEAPGLVQVRAESRQGFAKPVDVVLEAGRDRQIEIVLRRGTTLEGQVLDEDDNGVADADVTLEELATAASGGLPSPFFRQGTGVSDGTGRFTLTGLAPGSYRLHAQHPDFEAAAEDLELEPDSVHQVRIRLGPRFELVSIRGRVVDGTGQAVSGARVGLVGSREWSAGDTSSSDGSFHLRLPAPGTYALMASHSLFASSPAVDVEVTAGDVDGVVLELAAGASVHGRVLGLEPEDIRRVRIQARGPEHGYRAGTVGADAAYDIHGLTAGEWTVEAMLDRGRHVQETVTLAGPGDEALLDLTFPEGYSLRGVVLLDGRPLAGARVSSCGGSYAGFGSPVTGLDGAFAFDDLAPGPCEIRVSVSESPGLEVRRKLELSADEEVVLEIESASLDGTVADAVTGAPLAGAAIELLSGEADSNWTVVSAKSDAAGRFAFPRLAAGSWRIRATAEGYGAAVDAVTIAGAVGRDVRLRPTEPLVVEVRTASGKVPDFVTLVLAQGDGSASALFLSGEYRPDGEGRLVLRSVPSGRYRLSLSDPRGASAEVELEHPGAGPVRVVLDDG